MTTDEHVLIALPPVVADDLIAIGAAKRRISSQRSTATDAVLLTIGAGGSVVSLLQGPTTIADLARLLVDHVRRRPSALPLVPDVAPGELHAFSLTTETDKERLEEFLALVLRLDLHADVVVEARETSALATPAGWYHAEGDPEGTVRYWDGSLWHGGPVPQEG